MEAGHYPIHQFAHSTYAMNPHQPELDSNHYHLKVKQQPQIARVALGEEKNRKPIDPPPIVQLKINKDIDPEQSYLQSPYFFVSCNLVQPLGSVAPHPSGTALAGTLVSSLHRLKDSDNAEGAFFIFGDLSAKLEGIFALQFNLYEMRDNECFHIYSIVSDHFPVHGAKQFPGLSESTALTRSFSEQGVRLRVRKEPRTLLRKRGPASDNYVPRSYNRSRIEHETSEEQIGEDDSPLSSRHSQPELQGSMQSPQMMGPGRGYSQHSYSPYSEEPAVKRPRTGSEHGSQQEFVPQVQQQQQFAQQSQQVAYGGQQRPPQLSPYYGQESQQQQYMGNVYTQSPTATRDDYFPQQSFNPSQGAMAPGHTSNFPQHQTNYQEPPQYVRQLSSTQVISSGHYNYSGMGMEGGARHSGMGGSEMGAPGFPRVPITRYGQTLGVQRDRRASYAQGQGYGNPNPNTSAGSMIPGMGSSRSPSAHPITTGPGSVDSAYQ